MSNDETVVERVVMVHPDDVNLADVKAVAAQYDAHVVGNPHCPRGKTFLLTSRHPRPTSSGGAS